MNGGAADKAYNKEIKFDLDKEGKGSKFVNDFKNDRYMRYFF